MTPLVWGFCHCLYWKVAGCLFLAELTQQSLVLSLFGGNFVPAAASVLYFTHFCSYRKGLFTAHELNWIPVRELEYANANSSMNRALTVLFSLQPINTKNLCSRDADARDEWTRFATGSTCLGSFRVLWKWWTKLNQSSLMATTSQ